MFPYLTLHVEGGASIIQKTPVTTESVAAATISEDNCDLWKCDKLCYRQWKMVACLVILSPAELVAGLGGELCLLSWQEGTLHTNPQEEQEEEDVESYEVLGGHGRTDRTNSHWIIYEQQFNIV